MVENVKAGALYKINENRPCFAQLKKGDIVRVVKIIWDEQDGVTSIVVKKEHEKSTWFVENEHLDEVILNKGVE